MKLPTIVQLAKGQAEFDRYEDGSLWYDISWEEPSERYGDVMVRLFSFPIPVIGTEDAGGTFGRNEKGIILMRWARKHLEFLGKALAENVTEP